MRPSQPPPPTAELYGREGFRGDQVILIHADYPMRFKRVSGPIAERSFCVEDLGTEDATRADGAPLRLLYHDDLVIWVSKRREAMPFVYRNADGDELHFVERGRFLYQTDFGPLELGESEFIVIPRTVSYRVVPLTADNVVIISESPHRLEVDVPAGYGLFVDMVSTVAPKPEPMDGGRRDEHELRIKRDGEITTYVYDRFPLDTVAYLGKSPVFKFDYSDVHQPSVAEAILNPAKFFGTKDNRVLLCVLKSRPSIRPPIHRNVDYDEVIYYHRGPGSYGGVRRPGTFILTPKGINHQGAPEDVPEGFAAMQYQTRGTFRMTPEALAVSALVDPATKGKL